eukprot:scaffold2857_cov344-Pavlova_lutheri.AAC.37
MGSNAAFLKRHAVPPSLPSIPRLPSARTRVVRRERAAMPRWETRDGRCLPSLRHSPTRTHRDGPLSERRASAGVARIEGQVAAREGEREGLREGGRG